tara:strand:- start:9060 stop:9995 length:936 start_codon:yes stop_codon:yes gene_type:complete
MNIIKLPEEILTFIFLKLNRFYSPLLNLVCHDFSVANTYKKYIKILQYNQIVYDIFPLSLVDFYKERIITNPFHELLLDIYSFDGNTKNINNYKIGFKERKFRYIERGGKQYDLYLNGVIVIIANVFKKRSILLNQWLQNNLLINWKTYLDGFTNNKVSLLMSQYGDIDGMEWLWNRNYLYGDNSYRVIIKNRDIDKFLWLLNKQVPLDSLSILNSIVYGADLIFYYIWDKIIIVNHKFYYKDNFNDLEISFYWLIMNIIKYKRIDILKVISRIIKVNDYLKETDKNIIRERCSYYDDDELGASILRICGL